MFQASKLFDGYTCVFRQWRTDSHCRYLHGYALSFRFWFEGELDCNNWVWDFGGMGRTKELIDGKPPKEWLSWMFDHTTIIAEDDPHRAYFDALAKEGIAQVRYVPAVGAEKFAELLWHKFNPLVQSATAERVRIAQVEVYENTKNAASYQP